MKKLITILILALSVIMLTQCKEGIGGDNGPDSNNNGGNTEEPIEPNEPDEPEDTIYYGHDYVDLGLPSGVKWATCNVGASSPEEYGDYFAWGETEPKDSYTGYNSITYYQEFGDISGNVQYDAARANWGGTWRMPTADEMRELRDECTWQWITKNGVNGQRVTGPNGNSIFLPEAGSRGVTSTDYEGERGYYWSSTPLEDYDGGTYNLTFDNEGGRYVGYNFRCYGQSVRPVSE